VAAINRLVLEIRLHVDVSDYNRYVIEANKRLKQELQGNANVIYWNLKGLKENFTQNLSARSQLTCSIY
jgi:hypothetical protein